MPNNKSTCLRPEEREAVRREAMRGLSIREIADMPDYRLPKPQDIARATLKGADHE